METNCDCNPSLICATLGVPVGTGSHQVAAGNDPRLVGAPRVVENIAALRALAPPVPGVDSEHVIVQGYYQKGDGGGGEYSWDATAVGKIILFRVRSAYQLGSNLPDSITATISAPNVAGGTQATVTVVSDHVTDLLHNKNIANILIDNPGSGYTSEPTISFSPDILGSPTSPELHAWSPDFDDGGTTIAPTLPASSLLGRWRLISDPAVLDLAHFGLHYDSGTDADADDNSNRLDLAKSALPVYQPLLVRGSPTLVYSNEWINTNEFARVGTLILPNRNFYIGRTFNVTPGMTLSVPEGICAILAKEGFAHHNDQPKYMLNLALNGVYTGDSVYPADPSFYPNETYDFIIRGYLRLVGNWDQANVGHPTLNHNAGVRGAFLCGAQGCSIDRLEVENCGPGGQPAPGAFRGQITTTISAIRLSCLEGAAPGVVIIGSSANTYGEIDCEHLVDTGDGTDGDPQPATLIYGSNGVTIGTITGEKKDATTTTLQLKVVSSESLVVQSIICNEIANYVVLRGVCSGFQALGMSHNGEVLGNWIYDADPNTVASNGEPLVLPQSTIQYIQAPTLHGLTTADTIQAGALQIAGLPVPRTVLSNSIIGRARLVFHASILQNGFDCTPTYLVRIENIDGTMAEALFSIREGYDAGVPVVQTQMLRGSKLLVTTTPASFTPIGANPGYSYYPMEVHFTLVEPTPYYGNFSIVIVTIVNDILPTSQLSGSGLLPNPQRFLWSLVAETDTAVLNGTTPGTLSALAPVVDGKLPVKALALSNLFTLGDPRAHDRVDIAATDPDIEAVTDVGAYTMTLHPATGNAGLVRTISNVTPALGGNTLTVQTTSPDTFTDGTTSHDVAPGESIRLKVNSTADHFIIL